MNRKFRRLGVLLGVLILFGAFTVSRILSSMKEPPKRRASIELIREVEIIKVENGTVPSTLEVQGELVAFDKIDLFAEVSGTLKETAKPFKVGSYFPKGSVLIKLDDEEARLSLLSQKSTLLNAVTQLMPDLKIDYPESFEQWKLYLDQFELEEPIRAFPKPLNKQEKYFIASRNLHSQYYNIKSAEERLSKYTLYAPFSGVITQTSINPGALVRVGQKMGELMNPGNYELEATVPMRELRYIKTGNEVALISDDIEGKWTGRVKRINDQVDTKTQTVKVFISVSSKNLREGMYLRGQLEASSIEKAIKVPKTLLTGGEYVYEVRDSILKLQAIEVVKIMENAAIIRGLDDGFRLLKEIPPGAFDGMKVKVKTLD